MTSKQDEFDFGVVTFLDILGWKGIWERKTRPLARLNTILDIIKSATNAQENTKILSISDTIAIFSKYDNPPPLGGLDDSAQHYFEKCAYMYSTVDLHGLLGSMCIPVSIEHGIPIRGATCIGKFICTESGGFLGPAIDEAAEWYEAADWIGVHLTPSAKFYINEDYLLHNWVKWPAPFKRGPSWDTLCINWTKHWYTNTDTTVQQRKRALEKNFFELGPISPDITGKFTNTLKFFDKFAKEEIITV